MSLIMKLPQIIEESKRVYEEILSSADTSSYQPIEIIGQQVQNNILAKGDNLSFMKYLIDQKDLKGKINLIYIDPPFFSNADYRMEIKLQLNKTKKIQMVQKAYQDTWENGMEDYLKMLTVRLYLMKELLAEEGSIWVHLDWHAVHYVKIIMDEIFGSKNFINEIIWHYKSGGANKRCFAKKHDTLLFYAKSRNYYFLAQQEKSYNRDLRPYGFKGVKEYQDKIGWYTMVNRKDVWQLNMVGRTSAERTGYITQKPESLIERILESCTREGDLCADFFGGSGTLSAVASKMKRNWISCDIGRLATINAYKRLVDAGAEYSFYKERKRQRCGEGSGKIKADVCLQPSDVIDKMMLRVELLGYEIASDAEIPVQPKFMTIIEEIMNEDPLQLVAYWSIDTHYKGQPIQPDVCFYKENGKVKTVYESLGTKFGQVGIKVVDIFGNSTILTVNL
ncbi:MAG: DNA methyltransferase [Anaerovoracaceae bacterium]|jgi:site-specific DNA-methyltransferase (adenine-specific)